MEELIGHNLDPLNKVICNKTIFVESVPNSTIKNIINRNVKEGKRVDTTVKSFAE